MSAPPDRAEAVVIGGGIAGCSVAYHLARHGVRDVLLVEKGALTSGSTHHAAGLVTQFNPSPTMMRFRRGSVELYRRLGVFEQVGSLRIASSRDSLLELRRGLSRARAIGLEAELLTPREVVGLLPAASRESLFGAIWIEDDGYVDPHIATHAVAAAARELGVRFALNTRVTGIELGPRREVRAVLTENGRIATQTAVNAAGMWAPQVSAMVGAFTPSIPVDHQHVALHKVDEHELPRDAPCFRDLDNLVYGKAEAGGVLFGGYEPDPASRWEDGVPWDHGERGLPPDYARFAQLMDGAVRRFPFLHGAGVTALVCHPDAMTPDGNPLAGPVPGIHGFWVAAGLSLNGFGGAGGLGESVAQWLTTGDTELDLYSYRAWRFPEVYRNVAFAAGAAREVYKYYYRLRYPFDVDENARPQRLSPLYGRLQDAGAVFGTKAGWERADYFRPGRPWRRAGADQREFGWAEPPYLGRLRSEHEAIRERVGILDMTSFGKLEVSGAGALELLERVADNRIDRPVGSVVYTQFLNSRGGIVGDVTVTRLGDERFRVVTGAANAAAELGWLRLHARGGVELRDVSDDLTVIGIWGPRARDVLAAVTADDVSGEAFRFYTAQTLRIGGADVHAQRVTFVGELGFELYVAPEWAVQTWDHFAGAGHEHGLIPVGYRALDSLRIEKGYRYFGTDLTASDTPYEAGVGFCVARDKDFIGRDALDPSPRQRLRTLLVGGEEYVTVYGGEAVYVEDAVVGRVRSAAYGFTVGRNIALAKLPADLELGTALELDVLGERVPAVVAADVLYDPTHGRARA